MQCFLRFFQVFDRLIDSLDCLLKTIGCQTPVSSECSFEVVKLGFKIGDIDVLRLHQCQLRLVLQRIHGRIAKQRDDRNEELRPDHIHLRIAVKHVDNPGVVKLVLRLKQRNEHSIFAALFGAILVELLEEIFIFLLGRRFVALILHLEHDRDNLRARFIQVAEDVVAFAARPSVVVLLEIGFRKRCSPEAVELDLAMLLKGLANHLGR
ncbi:hypothetical protein SDC9_161867 [bioreactor metagenome]|uniref:Uncharacterized protein n=1 Tax=bioreactor metagenome TaxID=1076179 RepID=A0A645FKQ6_9ZZZZ